MATRIFEQFKAPALQILGQEGLRSAQRAGVSRTNFKKRAFDFNANFMPEQSPFVAIFCLKKVKNQQPPIYSLDNPV